LAARAYDRIRAWTGEGGRERGRKEGRKGGTYVVVAELEEDVGVLLVFKEVMKFDNVPVI